MVLRFKVRLADVSGRMQCEVKLPGRRNGKNADLKFET